jgi:hypothetical protein
MKNSNGGNSSARDERLQFMVTPAELNAVDDYKFRHRMPSRAAAVRELLRLGIEAKAPKGGGSPRKVPKS